MGLFSSAQIDAINQVAAKSKEIAAPPKPVKSKSITTELQTISDRVINYFKDSKSILITDVESLHQYVDNAVGAGYAGIDTETTGLDRVKDYVVGVSLYYPGGVECYIPIKHKVPIFDQPYKNQLSYDQVHSEFKRLQNSNIKLIFANADFDLAMIYKDIKVDFCDNCYYDVILAWRCLKENEKNNQLKVLYNKYVLKGKGDPMTFSDFFPVALFPYCKPEVAKLYAANDAKITYDLFVWQVRFLLKDNPKCQKMHFEHISDLFWSIEMPLVKVCQHMHRNGIYLDKQVANVISKRYSDKLQAEENKLHDMVQDIIDNRAYTSSGTRPFRSGKDFNPNSIVHVKYLLNTMLQLNVSSTGKEVLNEINLPVTNQMLKVRSLVTLIGTFVDKLPKATTPDSRIHAQFKQIGAGTGRMSSAEPNMQNIPSHAVDIRHMFRATPQADYQLESDIDADNCVQFVIDNGHKIQTDKGYKFVTDLVVNDEVILFDMDKEVKCNVQEINIEGSTTRICFHVI